MAYKRQCGSCQACCTLLPVKSLEKPSNTRCKHQRNGKGCAIYRELETFSPECRIWSCRWLVDPDVALYPIKRPDHAHYVIDIAPDAIRLLNEDGSERLECVVQVWIDPDHPDAHKDPALRHYLAMIGERDGMAAIIRWGSGHSAKLLIPPALNASGDFSFWEGTTEMTQDRLLEQAIDAGHVRLNVEIAPD